MDGPFICDDCRAIRLRDLARRLAEWIERGTIFWGPELRGERDAMLAEARALGLLPPKAAGAAPHFDVLATLGLLLGPEAE